MNRKDDVTDEVFVKIWQGSPSAWAVSQRIGCSVNSARQRAARLRKKGNELKKMRKGIDVQCPANTAAW